MVIQEEKSEMDGFVIHVNNHFRNHTTSYHEVAGKLILLHIQIQPK